MSSRYVKRSVSVSDESYISDSSSCKEEEKTIPFLRRLVDMLSENEDIISFYPGERDNGKTILLGRITVHDRAKVESKVLPRYFSHNSFASLRRQLNYFSFTRIGKGRQRGATYCNVAVVDLDDILQLKRRSAVGGTAPTPEITEDMVTPEPTTKNQTPKHGRRVSMDGSDLSLPRPAKKLRYWDETRVSRTVSPRASPTAVTPMEPRIVLDLTVPNQSSSTFTLGAPALIEDTDDIVAGSKALLNFSRGLAAM